MAKAEAEQKLAEAPGWQLAQDGLSISRQFKFKNFVEALAFVDRVGEIAEAEGHHPDIELSWLSTHAIKGLSLNDFIVAAKINELKRGVS